MRLLAALAIGLVLAGVARAASDVHRFWQRLAQCETGGRWDWGKYAGTSSVRPGEGSTFEGGVGFYAPTWTLWRRQLRVSYEHAWQAPPAVQMRVAAWGLAHGGYWGCLHNGSVESSSVPATATLLRQAIPRKKAPVTWRPWCRLFEDA